MSAATGAAEQTAIDVIPRTWQIIALAAAAFGFYVAFSGAYGGYARVYLPTALARGAMNAVIWYLIVVGLYLLIRLFRGRS